MNRAGSVLEIYITLRKMKNLRMKGADFWLFFN